MATRFLYRYVFRRTSTLILSTVVASLFFERAFDHACESIFEKINEGRLWADIKHKYEDPIVEVKYNRDLVDPKKSQDSTKKK